MDSGIERMSSRAVTLATGCCGNRGAEAFTGGLTVGAGRILVILLEPLSNTFDGEDFNLGSGLCLCHVGQ